MESPSLDVALATSRDLPDGSPDEALLIAALAKRGVRAAPAVWSDPALDWTRFRLCVIRSAWDSHLRRDEFVAWAERAGTLTDLWNSAAAVRWNTHKGYLRELAARGVPILPTAWLPRGEPAELSALLDARGWTDAVVKPAISAGAHDAIRVGPTGDRAAAQAHLSRVLERTEVMVQPYMASVEGYGERSLVFIDGEFAHAIRKRPALATAWQDIWEGETVAAADDELALARDILRAAVFPTLYARVDLVRDAQGAPRLMELEITEPFLFLKHSPRAAERLADAILRRLAAGSGARAER